MLKLTYPQPDNDLQPSVIVGHGAGTIPYYYAQDVRDAAEALSYFPWALSPEGREFWQTIYFRLLNLSNALESQLRGKA